MCSSSLQFGPEPATHMCIAIHPSTEVRALHTQPDMSLSPLDGQGSWAFLQHTPGPTGRVSKKDNSRVMETEISTIFHESGHTHAYTHKQFLGSVNAPVCKWQQSRREGGEHGSHPSLTTGSLGHNPSSLRQSNSNRWQSSQDCEVSM